VYHNHIYGDDFKKPFETGGTPGHVDFPRLSKGKNGGAFWSAFVPCPQNGSDFSNENYAECEFYRQHYILLYPVIKALDTFLN
jgi:membrane dipeptidase